MHYTLLEKQVRRHYHPKTTLVAVLTRGGRVLSIGKNIYKGKANKGIHAEVNAIAKAGNPAKGILSVIRMRKDGTFGCSEPCKECMEVIYKVGIKRIVYMNKGGKWCIKNI